MTLKTMLPLTAAVALAGGALWAQTTPPAGAPPRPGPAQGTPAPAPPAQRAARPPVAPLGDGPWDVATEKQALHVSVVTKDLVNPWGLAFLPDGGMLITERPGRLRLFKDGKLDPTPIAGLPPIYAQGLAGLMDVVLHPKFRQNHLIYMTYVKPAADGSANSTLAVMRARYDGGTTLSEVKDIFVVDDWYGALPLPQRCCGQGPATGSYGSRIVWDRKGKLIFGYGDRNYGERVQDPSNQVGKFFRLNDDGTVPKDNPFVGRAGYRPEIYSIGHRNPLGLAWHPVTHELWETEFGPRGGDELNVIKAGHNYGWISITQGAHYNGQPAGGVKDVSGYDDPVLTWAPSINPGNILFVAGNRFPGWKGDLLMPNMTRSLLRVSFDKAGKPIAQERMLEDLKQRLRDIRQGPDGALYVLTDEPKGALLKIEPRT